MEETNAKKERRTQKAMDVKTNDNISIDRFSDLPEHMIHQIVSLVPVKYATRTSVLSKRFRSAWLSNPVIEFNVNFFAHWVSYRKATQRLMDFVGDTLKRRDTKANLQKLTFRGYLDDTTFKVPVRSMINYALDKQVEELYLHGNVNGNLDGTLLLSGLCSLPKVMFCAKSIKVLEIEGFKIQAQNFILSCPLIEKFRLSCCVGLKSIRASGAQELKVVELEWCTGLEKIDIDALNLESLSYTGRHPPQPCEIVMTNCNSLRKLSLGCSTIMDQWLHYHVSRFHFLEILNLFGCPTLKYISVSHPNIKEIKLYNCVRVEKIDIAAQNLQSFTYGVVQSRQCDINISACKYLRNLSLYNATITDRWVEDNMAVLCLLETLRLECCNVLEKIKVHHDLLTCFELLDCKVVEAEIDAPNLSSFVYSGQLMLPPVITSSHWDAMIKLNTNLHNQQDPPSEWFTSLREFLLGFGTCNLLTLVCNDEKVLMIPIELRERMLPPLFDIRHVKINLPYQTNLVPLLQSLVWLIPHPETISFVRGSKKEFLKFEYDQLVAEKEDKSYCCFFRPIKCWSHRLKSIALHNFEDIDEKENIKRFFMMNGIRLEMIYENSDAFRIVKGKLIRT